MPLTHGPYDPFVSLLTDTTHQQPERRHTGIKALAAPRASYARRRIVSAEMRLQRVDEVGFLPGEAAVSLRLAAEVAI